MASLFINEFEREDKDKMYVAKIYKNKFKELQEKHVYKNFDLENYE